MDKLKIYGPLALAMMSVFMLGAYTDTVVNTDRTIEPHQWILTSFFGLMFMGMFLDRYKNKDY